MERLNAGHDRVVIRLGRGGGRVSAMSNARTEGGEKEKQQDFFTSFRELTEMRQNETRDERRETRRTREEAEKREEGKTRERRARENATKGE